MGGGLSTAFYIHLVCGIESHKLLLVDPDFILDAGLASADHAIPRHPGSTEVWEAQVQYICQRMGRF